VKPVGSLIWLRAQHPALAGAPSPGYSMQPVTRPERRYPPFEWFLPRWPGHAAGVTDGAITHRADAM